VRDECGGKLRVASDRSRPQRLALPDLRAAAVVVDVVSELTNSP
jgi:hypothetical protein